MTSAQAIAVADELSDAGYVTHVVCDDQQRTVVVPLRQRDGAVMEHEDVRRLLDVCDRHRLRVAFSAHGAHLTGR